MIKDGRAYTLKKEWSFRDQVAMEIKGDPDTVVDGDLFSDLEEDEQEIVKKWFFDNFEESKGYYCRCQISNSYGWKHRFEELIGRYVSNNQAKDAFLSWGFKPKDPNALNWIFKVKQKDRSLVAMHDSRFFSDATLRIGGEFKKRRDEKFWRYEDLSKYNNTGNRRWLH